MNEQAGVQSHEEEVGVRWLALAPKLAGRERWRSWERWRLIGCRASQALEGRWIRK